MDLLHLPIFPAPFRDLGSISIRYASQLQPGLTVRDLQKELLMNAITHFEIFGEDPARLADFYRNLFGWIVDRAPEIDYWRIQTGTEDSAGYSGGLTYRPDSTPHSWLNYVKVASVDDTIARVQDEGGRVVRPKTAVPRTAWYAIVADPEENVFGVWEIDPTASPLPESE
jgi:predicted enzyme related to lactoylglutathione lyase